MWYVHQHFRLNVEQSDHGQQRLIRFFTYEMQPSYIESNTSKMPKECQMESVFGQHYVTISSFCTEDD